MFPRRDHRTSQDQLSRKRVLVAVLVGVAWVWICVVWQPILWILPFGWHAIVREVYPPWLPEAGQHFLTFAALLFHTWFVLVLSTTVLGLLKPRIGHVIAWTVCAAYPAIDFLYEAYWIWMYSHHSDPTLRYAALWSPYIRVNTLIGAVLAFLGWWLAYRIRGGKRTPAVVDGRYVRCPSCDYDLRATTGEVCPECGGRIVDSR